MSHRLSLATLSSTISYFVATWIMTPQDVESTWDMVTDMLTYDEYMSKKTITVIMYTVVYVAVGLLLMFYISSSECWSRKQQVFFTYYYFLIAVIATVLVLFDSVQDLQNTLSQFV